VPSSAAQHHWDVAYSEGDATKSWKQDPPRTSLSVIDSVMGANKRAGLIDAGGGSSSLASQLVGAGYRDVSVLDLSVVALRLACQRMGAAASRVQWIVADVLDWEPARRYALWHDRAMLHFFVDDADRRRYADAARRAVQPGGHAVIATFAPDGPTECSGLPVRRSSAQGIAQLLGDEFGLVREDRELHQTPGGTEQPFTWVVLQRAAT
jgi:SAM-dependent methyltransferase